MVVSEPEFGTSVSEAQSHKKSSSGFGCKSGASFYIEAASAKGSHLPREISSHDKGHL